MLLVLVRAFVKDCLLLLCLCLWFNVVVHVNRSRQIELMVVIDRECIVCHWCRL